MKKPVEAIERMRKFYGSGHLWDDSVKIVLSYLDSIPEWPADLTRERLEELAGGGYSNWYGGSDALRRLAAIAPKREKRKVDLWKHETDGWQRWSYTSPEYEATWLKAGWRKVGEVEIDA